MKLFVKQDGGFRYLGEGTIYDKKNLRLVNEIDGSLQGTSTNVANGAKEAQKELNQTPAISGVEASAEKLDGNSQDNGPTLNVDTKSPESQREAQKMLNASGNDSKTTIRYYDSTKQQSNPPIGESRVHTKRLMEMRRNSIPFTKAELNRLLRQR